MSDHGDVRAALEIAAVEPGGLDRLEAGDTAEAAAIVGHLAGCAECLEEMARLRRAETLLRPIIAESPDPALRERTLAYVRALGTDRGGAAAVPVVPGAPTGLGVPSDAAVQAPSDPVLADLVPAGPALTVGPAARRRSQSVGLRAWAVSLAAVLVVGVFGGVLLGGAASGDDAAAALDAVTREMAALGAAGDAREAVLVDETGTPAGMLLVSPSAGRVVVAATGLAEPPPGVEHRCWVELDGERRVLGTMRRAGTVDWWAGDVALPAEIPPGVVYGVSLVPSGAEGPGSVVLTGEL